MTKKTPIVGLAMLVLLVVGSVEAAGPSTGQSKSQIASEQKFAASFNAASAELDRRRNLAISPYSAFESLAILQLGAAGDTHRAIERVAGVSRETAKSSAGFESLRTLSESAGYFFPGFAVGNQGYGLKLPENPLEGSAAAASGLGKGDLIFTVDSVPVRTEEEFQSLCRSSGGTIEITGYDFSTGRLIDKLKVSLKKAVIEGPDPSKPLLTAVGLWIDQRLANGSAFPLEVERRFGARVFPTRVFNSSQIAAQASSYFRTQTADRIRSIQLARLNPQTRFVLIHAAAMDAKWKKPFRESETKAGEFISPAGRRNVNYLRDVRSVSYARLEGLQVIDLPLQAGDLSMRIYLPAQPGGWLQAEKTWLSKANQATLNERFRRTPVDIQLPKFRVETNESLRGPYAAMGLGILFSDEANLSGISRDNGLKLSEVQQQTYVEIDEEGVRAGSVTQSVGSVKSLLPRDPVRFHARHPFLCQIVDASGLVLFAGRVTTPQPAE